MYGVIDIGSNTIRLCIYEAAGGDINLLFNNKNTAGLAGYVKNGALTQKGIKKTCSVLKQYRETVKNLPIKKLFVFATASLRNITNTDEALQAIYDETGLEVEVLTGGQEAVYDFIGAARSMSLNRGILIDIGGGSTELLVYEKGKIQNSVSFPFGSLSMYSNYVSGLFPKKKEKNEIISRTEEALKSVKFLEYKEFDTVIGIGGTVRAAKNMNNEIFEFPSENTAITAENIKKLLEILSGDEKRVLKKVLRTAPERVHTLIPGMLILEAVCRSVNAANIYVSPYGVREGYLYQKLYPENATP